MSSRCSNSVIGGQNLFILQQQKTIHNLKERNTSLERYVCELQVEINKKNESMFDKETKQNRLKKRNVVLVSALNDCYNDIISKNEDMKCLINNMEVYANTIKAKDAQVISLNKKIKDLHRQHIKDFNALHKNVYKEINELKLIITKLHENQEIDLLQNKTTKKRKRVV